MKPDKHTTKLKQILRARRKRHSLNSYEYEPLEKPIFVGYWRSFKVKADVLRSSIGLDVQKIVNTCNTFWLGKTKAPDSFRGPSFHLFPADDLEQTLSSIREADMALLDFKKSFIRKWFTMKTEHRLVRNKDIYTVYYVPKVRDHMIEFTYKKAYMTETLIPDGDAMSEEKMLSDFINRNNGINLLEGRFREPREANLVKKKVITRLLDEEIQNATLDPES